MTRCKLAGKWSPKDAGGQNGSAAGRECTCNQWGCTASLMRLSKRSRFLEGWWKKSRWRLYIISHPIYNATNINKSPEIGSTKYLQWRSDLDLFFHSHIFATATWPLWVKHRSSQGGNSTLNKGYSRIFGHGEQFWLFSLFLFMCVSHVFPCCFLCFHFLWSCTVFFIVHVIESYTMNQFNLCKLPSLKKKIWKNISKIVGIVFFWGGTSRVITGWRKYFHHAEAWKGVPNFFPGSLGCPRKLGSKVRISGCSNPQYIYILCI